MSLRAFFFVIASFFFCHCERSVAISLPDCFGTLCLAMTEGVPLRSSPLSLRAFFFVIASRRRGNLKPFPYPNTISPFLAHCIIIMKLQHKSKYPAWKEKIFVIPCLPSRTKVGILHKAMPRIIATICPIQRRGDAAKQYYVFALLRHRRK